MSRRMESLGLHQVTKGRMLSASKGQITPKFFRKLKVFTKLAQSEIDYFQSIEAQHGTLATGTDIIQTGDPYGPVYILNDGWAIRYRILHDGRRQIANFILPGDLLCLNATVMPYSDYAITTITPVNFSQFRVDDIIGLMENHPVLCAAIFWCNAREESILLEHLMSVGRRSAYERVAHLLLELLRRLDLLGLAAEGSFTMPLTQELIADSLGLTTIHVNRMMRALENDGLIVCNRRPSNKLIIKDIRGLEEAAGFEDGYLHFTEMPRKTRAVIDRLVRIHSLNG